MKDVELKIHPQPDLEQFGFDHVALLKDTLGKVSGSKGEKWCACWLGRMICLQENYVFRSKAETQREALAWFRWLLRYNILAKYAILTPGVRDWNDPILRRTIPRKWLAGQKFRDFSQTLLTQLEDEGYLEYRLLQAYVSAYV